MGNYNCCAIHPLESSPSDVWADEDEWGPMKQGRPTEKEGLLGEHEYDQGYLSSAAGSTGGQVRIRISKKQLEELLKKMKGNSTQKGKMKVDQALLQKLIDESFDLEIHHQDHHHQRPWKPALQSIPEVD